ncbi:MAG: type VI secretion system contractile sheath large subunit [Planctomycetia bacterium]|nr:type VI secretion system contractile sheath large subunit [Planctomycetia bacterium]
MNEREVHLNVGGSHEAAREVDPQTPFRILVCGDFSGRGNRGLKRTDRELSALKPVSIDRDNFEEALAQHDVRLERLFSGSDGAPVSVDVKEFDDFHPDRLFDRVEIFESLRGLRRRLLNRGTFDQAADEVRGWTAAPPQAPAQPPPAPAAANALENLFEDTGLVPREAGPEWNRFIRDTVSSYVVPGADPRQDEYVACVDAAISQSMRAILHDPDFQRVEAAWRGVSLLVHRLETDSSLQLFLLDLSRHELAAGLAGDDVSDSALYKLIVEKTVGTPGAKPWSALVGNFVFGPSDADAQLLGRLAKLAADAGAPWLAAAHGSIVGCPDPRQTPEFDDWQAPAAAWQERCACHMVRGRARSSPSNSTSWRATDATKTCCGATAGF